MNMLRYVATCCQEFANKLLETTNFLSVSQSDDRSLACCIVAIKAGNTCELLKQNEQNGRTCIPAASLTLLNYSSLLDDSRYSRIIAPAHIIHQWSWHQPDIGHLLLSPQFALQRSEHLRRNGRGSSERMTWRWPDRGLPMDPFSLVVSLNPNILWMWTFFPKYSNSSTFSTPIFLDKTHFVSQFRPPKKVHDFITTLSY